MRLSGRASRVVTYLTGRDWTSSMEISAAVWGKLHRSPSSTSTPLCDRLVGRRVLERSPGGDYRVRKSQTEGWSEIIRKGRAHGK